MTTAPKVSTPLRPDTVAPHPAADITWQAHPWKQESPARSAGLLLIIAATAAAATWSFGHLLYGVGSALLLLASTSRYLLPTTYTVDATGVCATHLWRSQHFSWCQVQRVDVQRDGLFLSPFRQPSRLDSYRGLFLRYGDDGAAVRAAVEAAQHKAGASDDHQ